MRTHFLTASLFVSCWGWWYVKSFYEDDVYRLNGWWWGLGCLKPQSIQAGKLITYCTKLSFWNLIEFWPLFAGKCLLKKAILRHFTGKNVLLMLIDFFAHIRAKNGISDFKNPKQCSRGFPLFVSASPPTFSQFCCFQKSRSTKSLFQSSKTFLLVLQK